MPTPTLFLNTSAVAWTLTGGSAVPLTRITQAGFSFGAEVINNRADLDIYDSSAHIVGWKPTVTFSGMNVGVYLQLISGIGLITWTIGNADLPGHTGSLIYTMSPAMNPLGDYSGSHAQYATGNLSMMGLAADGATNPLSYTVAMSGSLIGTKKLVMAKGSLVPSAFPFAPKLSLDSIQPDQPVDAVLIPPNLIKDSIPLRLAARMQVEGAKILGIDPDEAMVKPQGANRLIVKSPHFTVKHTRESDYPGRHRLIWKAREDGYILGYLTDEAKEEDE